MSTSRNEGRCRKMALMLMLLLAVMLPVISYGDAGVEGFWNTVYDTDYYVEVSASDGGANLREGAGAEYAKVISNMMPNGKVLHITQVGTADNGKKWGKTEYNGNTGWVALSQTKTVKAPSSGSEKASSGNDSSGTVAPASAAADYNVKVAAPDGGVYFRYGPGTAYGKIISTLIPNGTQLHIHGEGKASNGKTWGLTTFNGQEGWVFLGQTEKTAAAGSAAKNTQEAQPEQQAEQQAEKQETSKAQENAEQPANNNANTDSGVLTVSTNTLLLAALAIIGLLVIILLLTIVLLTRRR